MALKRDQITNQTRWQEIHDIWRDNQWLLLITGWVIGLLTLPALKLITSDLSTLLTNLVPEAFGIVFTVLIIEKFADNRATEALKKRLVREVSSESNEIAKAAVDWLRAEGWLTGDDGLLKGANLWRANLRGARLQGANLQGTNFWRANLNGAKLRGANLNGADLGRADFSEADLYEATLQSSKLHGTNLSSSNLAKSNLQDAYFYDTNLSGSNLWNAILIGTKPHYAQYDEKTALPDAKYVFDDGDGNMLFTEDSYWTRESDMLKYSEISNSKTN